MQPNFFTKEELEYLTEQHSAHEGQWSFIQKAMKTKFKKTYVLSQLRSRFYNQSYSQEIFWSKEEKDLLVKLKHSGLEWTDIVYKFNKEFSKQRTMNSLQNKYKRLIETEEYKEVKGHDFTRDALGDIVKNRDYESRIYVIAAVIPMTAEKRTEVEKSSDDEARAEEALEPNLHHLGWKSLENYVARNKAELCILPMRAHMKALQQQPYHYDPLLRGYKKNFVTDMTINGGIIKILEAHLNPQQINPLTGLGSLTGKNNKFLFQAEDAQGRIQDIFDKNRMASIIVGHPKQMMEPYPTGFESTPRVVHSTGAMTDPRYISNRVGKLAAESHTLGFLILEVKGRKFFIRQVQIHPETGEFVSMGVRYFPDGNAKRERADSLVFGDLHAGAHDPTSLECAFDMIRYFKPKKTYWHDVHDAKSYTHHDRKKMVTFLRNAHCFKSLKAEGEVGKQILSMIDEVNKEVDAEGVIVNSNHHDHLDRYLEEREFNNDRINNDLASDLYVVFKRGLNPLRCLIDSPSEDVLDVLRDGYNSKFRWLEPNSDEIRWGVQLGQHGHQGVMGSKGNNKQHSLAYNNAIVGHTHVPSIYNGVYTNGTLSWLRLDYSNGPLKTMHAHTVLYDGGFREMIVEIKGDWKLPNTPYDKID